MRLRFSVYHVYAFAWALATAAAILTAVVLTDTFAAVGAATAATQHDVGLEQLTALNLTVAASLHRLQIESANRLIDIRLYTSSLSAADMAPFTILDRITPPVLATWAPYIQAADEVYGYVANFLYPINATVTGYTFDNSIQIYADIFANFSRQFMISLTNRTDKLEHAFALVFPPTGSPEVGPEQYSFEWFQSSLTQALVADDFFFAPWPWAASDGHSFWYFTHQRYFRLHGVEGTVMTLATGFAWLDLMLSMRVPGSEFVIFDSNNMTLMATTASELARLRQCQGDFVDGVIPTTCIDQPSSAYPTPEIRAVFNRFYHPDWADLQAPVGPFQYDAFAIGGEPYVAAYGTLFSQNRLRLTAVWYQPRSAGAAGQTWVTPLICCMTVVSTVALSLLGIVGILQPLMRLGRGMRFVADSLKRGDTGVAIETRQPCVLLEVDRIGQDFETITVDFLGFSSSNARDTMSAPKDPSKPFAVVFTDIESSSLLWGKDPDEMARCLQLHHAIIRGLLKKYHLFEVKTVGDSFMVTSCSPDDAVRFAADLQVKFYECNWGWPEMEDVYQQKHVFLHHALSGRLTYEDLWNGLRVRVGIHFGHGEIVLDEVTKGFDYYGAVVNTASRIEAAGHGGQILISEAALRALTTPLPGRDFVVKEHGVHPLRGIQDPPALFEVLPVFLAGRTFPPLRAGFPESEAPGDGPGGLSTVVTPMRAHRAGSRLSTSAASQTYSASPSVVASAESLAQAHSLVHEGTVAAQTVVKHLLRTRETLVDALRPLTALQQSLTLKTICKAWGVPTPPGADDLTPALLTVAQRMAETPKFLARMAAKQHSPAAFAPP